MLAMGLLGTKLWAKVLDVPKNVLTPMVLAVTSSPPTRSQQRLWSGWLDLRCLGVRDAKV
jgi:TctA family transporter